MYYHVHGEVTIVIDANSEDEARQAAEEWGHETVFDFRIKEVV